MRPMGDRTRQQPPVRTPPPLGGLDITGNAPHAQFLATEHWSLLATRSMTWNEIFSRTGTYLTVLSATVIALSLVANATGFGQDFRTFALLVPRIVLLVGVGTYFRLVEADIEDGWLVIRPVNPEWVPDIVAAAVAMGGRVHAVDPGRRTLEELFLDVIRGSAPGDRA